MHDAEGVRFVDGCKDVTDNSNGLGGRKRAVGAELGERQALDVFGGHDELAVEFEGVVKGHNVGVGKASVDANLAEEPVASFGIAGGCAGESTQRFELTRRSIPYLVSYAGLGFVDDTEEFIKVGRPGG